jgi:hypothetical protein
LTPVLGRRARGALTAVLAVYGLFLLFHPQHYGWLDAVDLAIHETGHLVFAPFGDVITALGGTLLQLLLPAAFAVYFTRRGDGHAASVAWWWVAQNLWNVSVYVGDALAQELPLVGGGEHDWAYLLAEFGVLRHDREIATGVRLLGAMVFGFATIRGFATVGRASEAPAG